MTGPVVVRPIRAEDAVPVADFLHRHLNPQVSAAAWARVILPPWEDGQAPNRGFQLVADDRVVGANLAVYSTRQTPQGSVRVCNLAALCVEEEHRGQALRLVRAVMKQPGYEFTDLSPSGAVVALNERLGFRRLDTTTSLVVNVPRPPQKGVQVTGDPRMLADVLQGRAADVFRDHVDAPAARHLVVRRDGGQAYLMFRRSTRRRLPWFAAPLYVGGDRDLLREAWPTVASHLLTQHRLPATLAEQRVLGFRPAGGVALRHPRPKMAKTTRLDPEQVDYLYSELTLLEW